MKARCCRIAVVVFCFMFSSLVFTACESGSGNAYVDRLLGIWTLSFPDDSEPDMVLLLATFSDGVFGLARSGSYSADFVRGTISGNTVRLTVLDWWDGDIEYMVSATLSGNALTGTAQEYSTDGEWVRATHEVSAVRQDLPSQGLTGCWQFNGLDGVPVTLFVYEVQSDVESVAYRSGTFYGTSAWGTEVYIDYHGSRYCMIDLGPVRYGAGGSISIEDSEHGEGTTGIERNPTGRGSTSTTLGPGNGQGDNGADDDDQDVVNWPGQLTGSFTGKCSSSVAGSGTGEARGSVTITINPDLSCSVKLGDWGTIYGTVTPNGSSASINASGSLDLAGRVEFSGTLRSGGSTVSGDGKYSTSGGYGGTSCSGNWEARR